MKRALTLAGVLFLGAVAWQQCAPAPPPPPPAAAPAVATAPPIDPANLLSIKELMEFIVDPVADYIFDAAVVDVSAKGTVAKQPVSDEDWATIERGAWQLAESMYLLQMPRRVVPAGFVEPVHEPGKPGPELSGAEVQAKIDADRALWNKHTEDMRLVAMEAVAVVKARDAEKLFDVGSKVDKACEACHLEYWYPGDRAAVEADAKKKVTFDPPAKK